MSPLGRPDSPLPVLLDAVQRLALARTLEEIQAIVRTAARWLVDADGATFVLRDGERCFYADEDAISPLWKGQRFPLAACISGWAMLERTAVAIEDIYLDRRIPHDAYRPTFVRSLVMTPIRTADPIGAIGMYWADHHRATEQELALAKALADSTALAIENVRRTQDLERVAELAGTDPLTGVSNRRAWDVLLDRELRSGAASICLLVLDLDDFKGFNDRHGHQAGDELLRAAARAWRGQLRAHDALARFGGDEFVVLMPGCSAAAAEQVAQRLRAATPEGGSVSIGLAHWDGRESAASLLGRADAALFRAKRDGRGRVALALAA